MGLPLPYVIFFGSYDTISCCFFPDCIGLNPVTYESAAGNSDYKNFTLKFYKLDVYMFAFQFDHYFSLQISPCTLNSLCVCLQADQCNSGLPAEGYQHSNHYKQ